MSLQKFLALLAVVDNGSISKAAEQMGYTQSAVSRMIADLEREWGVELLRRNKSGIVVTSEGSHMLPTIRAIAADCHELNYSVQELRGIHAGLIRVGTFTTVADYWIPQLLKSFQQLYPNIAFKLINGESYEEIEEWIRRGEVDCGFVRMPATSDLQAHFLKKDQLSAVLPVDHPLAEAETYPTAQLESESIIKLKVDREISQFLEGLPFQYEVSSDHTILSMVESGVGVSIMHSLMADRCRYHVVWKPLDKTQYRDIGIAVHKNARVSSVTRLFVEHVCKVFEK